MTSELLIGRFSSGIVIRVIGRGTMRESPAFRAAAGFGLQAGTVIFDATQCEYLDSTFLGCLIGLKKACDGAPNRRFVIAASPATRIKLFCTSSLDRYFDFIDAPPEVVAPCAAIDIENLKREEMGRHIMSCHQRLAEMGGGQSATFQAVADRLAKELGVQARAD